MNTTERKAVEVLAVMDDSVCGMEQEGVIQHLQVSADALREARAAVAEVFAERDRLANIVRSHEKQILRMTAERAELIEACEKAIEWLEGWASAEPYLSVLRDATAKATGGAA